MGRLTRRYIIKTIDNLSLSLPIRYERYYINDNLRVQKKGDIFIKEVLDEGNAILEKKEIGEDEFREIIKDSYCFLLRDSYLYLDDNRISIKKYYGDFMGLIRVEVSFNNKDEMNNYQKLEWMGQEITFSPLAFDKNLSKLNKKEFLDELNKYL